MQVATRRFAISVVAFLSICLYCHSTSGQHVERNAQLYFFTNAACGPCRLVEPELEKLYRAGYPVMKIDTQLHPDWTRRFQIQKTPTVVLVSGQSVVARHSGFIDADTLRGWFQRLESTGPEDRNGEDAAIDRSPPHLPSTSHTGTRQPATSAEKLALQATVRLKVDDRAASSYATGTVIHFHAGEALVLTCGHVFRDSGGDGEISVEYGFDKPVRQVTSGELLHYDADAHDVALVSIPVDGEIQPVEVAQLDLPVGKRDPVFSIGCDHGALPTIRNTLVKNQAKYDGVEKYEIYGRPVNGRSGGGLFTADGKLIGVCNAAVVDVDEGVYGALDSLYWQLEQVNLAHLFQPHAPSPARPRHAMVASRNSNRRDLEDVPVLQLGSDRHVSVQSSPPTSQMTSDAGRIQTPQENRERSEELELIVVVRGRDATESFTISNPSTDLLQQLRNSQYGPADPLSSSRLARMRRDMPKLQGDSGKKYSTDKLRAQSPH